MAWPFKASPKEPQPPENRFRNRRGEVKFTRSRASGLDSERQAHTRVHADVRVPTLQTAATLTPRTLPDHRTTIVRIIAVRTTAVGRTTAGQTSTIEVFPIEEALS